MSDFQKSAVLMAKQLRVMQRLQQAHRDMGDTEVLLDVRDLFSPDDAAALAAFEKNCAEIFGAEVPLPFGVSA